MTKLNTTTANTNNTAFSLEMVTYNIRNHRFLQRVENNSLTQMEKAFWHAFCSDLGENSHSKDVINFLKGGNKVAVQIGMAMTALRQIVVENNKEGKVGTDRWNLFSSTLSFFGTEVGKVITLPGTKGKEDFAVILDEEAYPIEYFSTASEAWKAWGEIIDAHPGRYEMFKVKLAF